MLGEEELGASFLITLKHRSVTPDLVDGASQCLADMLEPMEGLQHPGTESTYNFILVSNQDRAERKNDTHHDHGPSPSLHRPGVSFSMALPEDAHWLSDLQCYVRANCCEFFVAGENDVKTSPSTLRRSNSSANGTSGGGRRGRVSIGRVGIRCMFCRDLPSSARAAQSTSFPSQITGIYGAIVMMQCRHFNHCGMMPESVRSTLERIRGTRNTSPPPGLLPGDNTPPPSNTSSNTPGRQQYWAESARRVGLRDTPDGIRLAPPSEQVDAPSDPAAFKPIDYATPCSVESSEAPDASTAAPPGKKSKNHALVTPDMSAVASEALEVPDLSLPSSLNSLMGDTALVSAEDKDLVPDYLFLAMAQMKPCTLTESDRVGCYKERNVGFVGMCCKHCGGQPGFGKYFPATVRSLAQTTTSQTIIKHVGVKCRLCPVEVRNAVLALQQNSHDKPGCNYSRGPSSANDGRPKYGSRKVFFQRVWGRLHGEAVPDIPDFEAQHQAQQAAVAAAAFANKKRARPQSEEVNVTPDYGDVTSGERGGDDDANSLDDGSSAASSVAGSSIARPSIRVLKEYSSSSSDEDRRPLTDDLNRRVTVWAGGSRVVSHSSGSRNRRRPILPTKASAAKRKNITTDEDINNKRDRNLQ